MKETHRRCCGIDVHQKSVTVCVLAPFGQRHIEAKKRKFRTYTRDLKQMRAWLKNCQVTGDRDGIDGPILAAAVELAGRRVRQVDSGDLLENGKLRGSWVPPRPIRELRDLTRHRVNLLEDLNRAKNRIEQLCQTGNIKVSSVATDLFGVSGCKMLKAIIEGKRGPGWMADYARGTLRSKRRELELALEGTFTGEQRWLLDKELRQVEWLEAQTDALEQEIERRVAVFEEPIQRLLTIPGIDRKTAWTIVAEVGVDLSAFADAKHLASYVKRAMCQAAWAASHTKDTYLSAFYRRMSIRKGSSKAVMPLAHHMMVVVHQVLSRREEYVEFGGDYYDRRNKPKTVARLTARLARLGYYVSLRPIEPEPKAAPDGPLPAATAADAACVGVRRRGPPL